MNIWLKSILTGAVFSLLIFTAIDKLGNRKDVKSYNADFLLLATNPANKKPSSNTRAIITILEKRLDNSGHLYRIKDADKGLISISLLYVTDTLITRQELTTTGAIQFRELYNNNELDSFLVAVKTEMNRSNKEQFIEFRKVLTDQYEQVLLPAEIGTVKVKDSSRARKLFDHDKLKVSGRQGIQICFGRSPDTGKIKNGDHRIPIYFLKTANSPGNVLLDNNDIRDAYVANSPNESQEIRMEFNFAGTKKWVTMTGNNIGRQLAILIDGIVVSAPLVLSAIESGEASITGKFTDDEYDLLCNQVRNPPLPAKVEVVSSVIKQNKPVPNFQLNPAVVILGFLILTTAAFYIFKTLSPRRI